MGAMVGAPGCPRPRVEDRPPVNLALQFVARQSCGRISALAYDTSCTHAVYVRALSASRQPLYERCIELTDVPADLGELLQGEPLFSFGGLSTNTSVIFEVRGLHDKGLSPSQSGALCDNPAQNDQWLFWGESDLVDLRTYDHSDAGTALIPIVVDCRDCSEPCEAGECFGCNAMGDSGDAGCPAVFPPSVCAPASAAMCGIPCDERADCFDGAQDCVADRCVTDDTSGTLCSRCNADTPCQAGLSCVRRGAQGDGVCAPSCPDTTCVTGTKCTRIGNNLEVVEAASE
jgi:hypothetical protein